MGKLPLDERMQKSILWGMLPGQRRRKWKALIAEVSELLFLVNKLKNKIVQLETSEITAIRRMNAAEDAKARMMASM